MNQLYDIMYEFNFSLPPDYALVIRALGSLEGTAKVLDPDFKVIESAYPFVIGRLIADPSPDMRRILRELVIRNNGSIRWNRLERLVRYKFFYHASHVIITWNVDSNIFCKLINSYS
jgi:aarF domain-containing kinase